MKLFNKYSVNTKTIFILLLVSLIINIYQGVEINKYEDLSLNLEKTINDLQNDLIEENEHNSSDENIDLTFIQVAGEVRNPGVYQFDSAVKVFKIIEKAGGLTEDANVENINLVETAYDGDKIYIPNEDDIVKNQISTSQGEYVNINKASKEELMALQGIGEAKASAIIKYRETVKRFNSKEDILEVSGIGSAVYDKIETSIRVN